MRHLLLLLLLACTGTVAEDTSAPSEDSDPPVEDSAESEQARFLVDEDGDGFAIAGGDCADDDASVRIGLPEVACDGIDQDCDDVIDEGTACGDDDGDGTSEADGDCHDDDSSIGPHASEIPLNGIDDDCDGTVDAGSLDIDEDGYDPGLDCDDADPSKNPGAAELPDGEDDDCDGVIDEGTLAYDHDGDCFCAFSGGVCTASAGTCATIRPRDCDDQRADRFPGNTELDDDRDNDCDLQVDEHTASRDDDGDGFAESGGDCDDGDAAKHPGAASEADRCDAIWPTCAAVDDCDGDGSLDTVDCHDGDASIHPTATELADGIDRDCDGRVDEGTAATDDDGDGESEDGGDCDDGDAARNTAETETADGVDQDCDGTVDEQTTAFDDDRDGMTEDQGDCDDTRAEVRRGLPEIVGNGFDDDCDGFSASAIDPDGDGFTPIGGDCSDFDATKHPGATELPNSLDDDCDNAIDEGTTRDDADNDGFCVGFDHNGDGTPTCHTTSDQPGDCDDTDEKVCPDCAVLTRDGKDSDCDGEVD
ncbi:MAG: putative metal-binding motif-containing protein [Proteobacteria bacterium]|nr:putative metal-binding motif-containing protein [Pseudomonadota bacterium]